MGPQSSGKSTLLNHLFGTKFTEMDAMSYRGQTTQARAQSSASSECPGFRPRCAASHAARRAPRTVLMTWRRS